MDWHQPPINANLLNLPVPHMPFGLLEISFQLQDHFYLYLDAIALQAGDRIYRV